jgi:hypothetical protein
VGGVEIKLSKTVDAIFSFEAKGKGKGEAAPVHAIEIYMEGGSKAPLILKLGRR